MSAGYIIRKLEPAEYHRLRDFTYEAIFKRDENEVVPPDVLEVPEIKAFYEDFGKPDDLCYVAELDGELTGAVWTRIISGEIKGYGNIDPETPEFGISLYKEHRGKGIGTALMKRMLTELKDRGYKKASLSVQKDNYAARMYLNIGFNIIEEHETDYLMVYYLGK